VGKLPFSKNTGANRRKDNRIHFFSSILKS